MAYLSIPCRVLYESKAQLSGLEGVHAWVLKPDSSIGGPYPMREAPSAFYGHYFFDYLSTINDPAGEYFFRIDSPQENVTSTLRIPLYVPPPGTGVVNGLVDVGPVIGLVRPTADIVGRIIDVASTGVVDSLDVSAEIKDANVSGDVASTNIKGSVYELP